MKYQVFVTYLARSRERGLSRDTFGTAAHTGCALLLSNEFSRDSHDAMRRSGGRRAASWNVMSLA